MLMNESYRLKMLNYQFPLLWFQIIFFYILSTVRDFLKMFLITFLYLFFVFILFTMTVFLFTVSVLAIKG